MRSEAAVSKKAKNLPFRRHFAAASVLDDRRWFDRVFYLARLATTVIAGLLPLLFAFLTLRDIKVEPFIEYTSYQFYIRIALTIYYFCWMYGAAFDYQTQQDVYVIDPNKGRIPKGFFVFVPVFVVIAVSLLLASIQNERYLAVALTLFCILDVIGWHHNQTWMKPIFEASFKFYETEHDYFGYERLSFAKSFFFGRWALWRYATMLAILGSILLISFNGTARDNLSQAIHHTTSLDSAKINEITPGVLILFFVLTAETWIWVNRIRVRVSMDAIASVKDKIALHFREVPKK